MIETDNNREFYYVTYMGVGIGGAICIPQMLMPDGSSSPDGFNIMAATKWLYERFGDVVVIQSWHKTTLKRVIEFEEWVHYIQGSSASPSREKVAHLRLIKEEVPPNAGA